MKDKPLSRTELEDSAMKEVEALAAAKQTQDSPQLLHPDNNKNFVPHQENVADKPGLTKRPAGADSASELPPDSADSGGTKQTPALLSAFAPRVPADEMKRVLQGYCVLTDHEVDAVVLWLISSYLINSFRIFPKLALISPEKRCGKTTTMEVIASMSKNGVMASNISPAAIYRITEQLQPTLFIDEADTFIKNGDPQLVGLVNSSHTKAGAMVVKCTGDDHQAKPYSTWMPIVLASIGDLPSTIMDRSIVINMRRKKTSEHTEEIPIDILELKKCLRESLQAWCSAEGSIISSCKVSPPDVGNDRAADNWAPLFKVAAAIGGAWPERCERAFRALSKPIELELSTQLLVDIRACFNRRADERVSSASLVEELCSEEDCPWLTFSNGKKLSPNQMANLLSPYGIKPRTIRFGAQTKRGYEKVQFDDAFERYLPSGGAIK